MADKTGIESLRSNLGGLFLEYQAMKALLRSSIGTRWYSDVQRLMKTPNHKAACRTFDESLAALQSDQNDAVLIEPLLEALQKLNLG